MIILVSVMNPSAKIFGLEIIPLMLELGDSESISLLVMGTVRSEV